MEYTKEALLEMAKTAAEAYLTRQAPMSGEIRKMAEKHQLSDAHVERVCNYANHIVNKSLMAKEAYTSFPLARPDEVLSAKTAHVIPVMDVAVDFEPEDESSFQAVSGGTFSKLARFYGADFEPTGDAREDARRFIKAAEIVATAALESFDVQKIAMESEQEELYQQIKDALLQGVPRETVFKAIAEQGGESAINEIWDRLEADGMVPVSHYDDAGPYSLERAYKTAALDEEVAQDRDLHLIEYNINPNGPMIGAVRAFEQSVKQASLDVLAADMCLRGLDRIDRLFETDEDLQKAAAGALGRVLKSTGSGVWKGTKNVADLTRRLGSWVGKKPMMRLLMGAGVAGAAGEGQSRIKNRMQEPRMRLT